MPTPQPGNVLTIFRSRLRPEAADEYTAMADDVLALAEKMPGFLSLDRFTSEDGERLSVVLFEDAETELAWRNQPGHKEAQQAGRDRFYAEYSIAVCEVLRSSEHG